METIFGEFTRGRPEIALASDAQATAGAGVAVQVRGDMSVTTQVGEYALDVDGGGRASGFYAYNGRLTPERTLAEETFLESDDYLGTPNGSAGGSPLWMGEAAFGDTLTVQSEDQPEGGLLLPTSRMAAASTEIGQGWGRERGGR